MAATGYTPIKLYASTTPSAIPLAANLDNTNGAELAINIYDGKLYYKNASNVVTLLASASDIGGVSTFSGGTTGLTPSTASTGAITLAGTLVAANGGTGQSSYTTGDLIYASGSTALSKLAIGTANYFLSSSGTGPQWTQTLGVANGGSGANSLTGILKGNGTSAFTAASAGTDYVSPSVASTFTALETFAGTSSNAALKTANIKEVTTISGTAATGTINFDITTQSILYYTTSASGNWTVNFRGSSGTSMDTIMSTGESMSCTFLATQGSTAYYNSSVQVDGTTSGVTTKWQGGTAPTSGNASSIDSYTYVITKTGAGAFTVLATQTKFA